MQDCNCRTGNFTKFTYLVHRGDFFRLTIGDGCVAWNFWPSVEPPTFEGCVFLNTESMEVTEIPLYCSYTIKFT